MKAVCRFLTISTLGMSLVGGPLFAQRGGYDNRRYVQHREWKRGYRMQRGDWSRGERIDYRRFRHLHAPPRGYEWREVDGNFVMAAVATGVIASVIAASAAQ